MIFPNGGKIPTYRIEILLNELQEREIQSKSAEKQNICL
jgi:hypothetical protein